MEGEKNSSIRKFLFKASFNYYNKNPAEKQLWDIVKQNVTLMDINDKEAFDILMDITKVPKICLVDYIIFTWEFLENHPNAQESNFITAKSLLLDAVTADVIPNTPKTFCLNIIEKYFLKFDQLTEFHKTIVFFTVKILIYSTPETDQQEYLKMVFEMLNRYIISSNWKKAEVKKVISCFVQNFCHYFSKKLSSNNCILEKFLGCWNKLLQPHQAFEEYLCLNFTLIFLNLNTAEIAVRLAEFCNNVLGVYGIAVTDMFCASLKNHVLNFLSVDNQDDVNLKEDNLFVLIDNIIKFSNSINCLLVVISLLPREISKSASLKQKYDKVMKELENNSDLRVQLAFCIYLLENVEIQKMIVPSYNGLRNTRESKRRNMLWAMGDYSSKYKR
ncbi:hypothetical protein ILUMI_19857 [Ignelater luminosus]|uniref:Uncharacterized protein n=1 Tax=Ignelater luminosus TaxID=2038154 RepID=A0A8K0CJM8_IGNLU|nr:hypothetical protein ILUMI_19857 [Ignelater luminosus]